MVTAPRTPFGDASRSEPVAPGLARSVAGRGPPDGGRARAWVHIDRVRRDHRRVVDGRFHAHSDLHAPAGHVKTPKEVDAAREAYCESKSHVSARQLSAAGTGAWKRVPTGTLGPTRSAADGATLYGCSYRAVDGPARAASAGLIIALPRAQDLPLRRAVRLKEPPLLPLPEFGEHAYITGTDATARSLVQVGCAGRDARSDPDAKGFLLTVGAHESAHFDKVRFVKYVAKLACRPR
jgi:hypothetical protein